MSGAKRAIRVLIADDHPTTRMGIRAALEGERDIEVVGEAQDGTAAIRMVAELRPDILLLNLVMPGPRPYEVERWVRANHPETTTLVLTAHDRDCYLAKMIEAGVMGFLPKGEPEGRLVQAIRRAARGEVLITGEQLRRVESWRDAVVARCETLTRREIDVLALLVGGSCTEEIAEALRIEKTTVDTHVGNILSKLGIASRAAAIAWAWEHRVFETMDPGSESRR